METVKVIRQLKAIANTIDWMDEADKLGVDFEKIDPREWLKGCRHELEHWQTVKGNRAMIAGIALDHLREDKEYYNKLAKIE